MQCRIACDNYKWRNNVYPRPIFDKPTLAKLEQKFHASMEMSAEEIFLGLWNYIFLLERQCAHREIQQEIRVPKTDEFRAAKAAIIKNPAALSNQHKKRILMELDSDYFMIDELHQLFEKAAGPQLMEILKNISDEEVLSFSIFETSPAKSAKPWTLANAHEFIAKIYEQSDTDILLNIDETDRNGFTRLSWAANFGCLELVTQYLEAGADPNVLDHSGNNALIRAVYGNHLAVVELLLKNNTHPNTVNKAGHSALSLALRDHFFDMANLLLDQPTMDVNIKPHQDAFLKIIHKKNHALIVLFIKKGMDKKILGQALVQAFHQGDHDTISLLIDAKPNLELNALNTLSWFDLEEKKSEVTPLEYAIAKKDLNSTTKFLLAGATLKDPRKLYLFLMNLTNNEMKPNLFGKLKKLPTKIETANLYHCLDFLMKMPLDTTSFTKKEREKLQSMYKKIKMAHEEICKTVDQITHFPDEILKMIDEYHHPHGHLKPK